MKIPTATFEDKDLLTSIQNLTGFDMTNMIVVNKKIVNNNIEVFYRPKR